MSKKTEEPQLLERTRELMRDRATHVTVDLISKRTGLSVGWLNKFSAEVAEDPGVNKVETLFNYFSDEPLFDTENE